MTFQAEHVYARAENMAGDTRGLRIAPVLLPPLAYAGFPLMPPIPAPGMTGAEAWRDFVTHANGNARKLQTIIDDLRSAGGGTVFFPPGRYYLGRAPRFASLTTDAPDLLVPPDVVLEFAPGAVLVPMNFAPSGSGARPREGTPDEEPLVILEIQGSIRAGLHEIFATTLYPRPIGTADVPPYEPSIRAGKVIFTGNQVREVYPEWWGVLTQFDGSEVNENGRRFRAGGHWGIRNSRAFQAAIDAGHTDRFRPVRNEEGEVLRAGEEVVWRQETTIPVVAMYEYFLEGGLLVGLSRAVERRADPAFRRSNPAAFEMRGGCEPTLGTATLRAMINIARPNAAATSPWVKSPMLTMRDVASFYIEEVGFNANDVAFGAVDLQLGARGGVGEFNRCMFQNLRHEEGATLITVETPRDEDPAATGEAIHVAFTACRMTPLILNFPPLGRGNPAPENQPGHMVYVERLRAMVLDYDDRCSVELRGCHLQGVCDPMIHARRGHIALNETVFHGNRRVNSVAPATAAPVHEWRRFWNSTNGTDLLIDRPVQVGGRDAAPASFTAREVETQSFQFVSTWMDGDPAAPRRTGPAPTGRRASYVLLNTHHTAAPGGSTSDQESQGTADGAGADPHPFPSEQYRPSISWEGTGQIGCHLVAIGCCLQNRYRGAGGLSEDFGGIRLGSRQRGAIILVANTTAYNALASSFHSPGGDPIAPGFLVSDPGFPPSGVFVPALGAASAVEL